MTAVEYLKYELNRRQAIIDSEPIGIVKESMYANLYVDLFEQALEMEKEQIINAAADHCYPTCELARIDAEIYYNETFNK
jgi:hypothetical protein